MILKILFNCLFFISLCYGQVSFYNGKDGCYINNKPTIENVPFNQCVYASDYTYVMITGTSNGNDSVIAVCKNDKCDLDCFKANLGNVTGCTSFLDEPKFSIFVDPVGSNGVLSLKTNLVLPSIIGAILLAFI